MLSSFVPAMDGFWPEFGQVALMHLLAVASPGPDFAMVLRQSLAHGRRTAIWTALGVGAAILLHVAYSLLGFGLLIHGSERWFTAVKYAGAAYLAWIGVQALRAQPRAEYADASHGPAPTRGAFATGFMTNALNPKATLFFISLFALVVSPQTPKLLQAAYGLWMAAATAAWFSLVALLFTQDAVRRPFLRHGHWLDRALGVVFLAFAVSLVLASAR
ncbi:MAG: LysE family transporter [Opitutaceae bacterium]|nr:LysE family transporter [Opitutaceae bacterium]